MADYLCDDEMIKIASTSGKTWDRVLVGNLRNAGGTLAAIVPEDKPIRVPASGLEIPVAFKDEESLDIVIQWVIDGLQAIEVPEDCSLERIKKAMEKLQLPAAAELDEYEDENDELDEDDTFSSTSGQVSPVRAQVSNIRQAISSGYNEQLDSAFSMTSQQLFGRAIALLRQSDSIVKISDIQHGLSLLRELLSQNTKNTAYMYYLAYGELRLGNTAQAAYWINKLLTIEPHNLAGLSLSTLIDDKKKVNSFTGILIIGALAFLGGVGFYAMKD